MTDNKTQHYPALHKRLYSVWFRHMRVYSQNIFSNAFPPFFEPLIFLAGVGLGLGNDIGAINGQSYIDFLAIGLLVTSSMWTAFFECTFGTFIRLEFQKVYDGILAAPITANDLIVGEISMGGVEGIFLYVRRIGDVVDCVADSGGRIEYPAAECTGSTAGRFCQCGDVRVDGVADYVVCENHQSF